MNTTHIHVCLVSDQPIPNLTSILQFKPDMIILLKTKEMEEKANLLVNVLKNKNYFINTETIEAYDINSVIKVSNSLLEKYKNTHITLNITGGTKISTLGIFQTFYNAQRPIYYADTKDKKIIQLYPVSEQKEIPINVSVSISDYLEVYGFIIDSYVEDDSYIYKRKELTDYIANTAILNENIISRINSSLHNYTEQSSLPITIKLPNDKKLIDHIKNLDGIEYKNKNNIKIIKLSSLRYLKGIWFEEYVYMIAKSLNPDEIKLNVKGKWITKSSLSPMNEFDIMISKGNKLYLISCKTSNPDRKITNNNETISKEYIYELVSLSDRTLGIFGKRMLASARTINDLNVKERAKILKVDIIDGKNIMTLKEKLRQWLQ